MFSPRGWEHSKDSYFHCSYNIELEVLSQKAKTVQKSQIDWKGSSKMGSMYKLHDYLSTKPQGIWKKKKSSRTEFSKFVGNKYNAQKSIIL